MSDTTGTLEGFDYLGLDTVARRSHPEPDARRVGMLLPTSRFTFCPFCAFANENVKEAARDVAAAGLCLHFPMPPSVAA